VFTNDANVAYVATSNPVTVPRLLATSSSTNFAQDIATFLRKPVILSSGHFSIADVTSTPVLTANLPYDAISASSIFSDKIKGFLGIRCDMHLRWQINGNRFQQGRYMLAYVPTGGASLLSPSTPLSIASHTNTLVQRTQLFRVELDVNCDTEGTLVIPYLSSMNYCPIVGFRGGSGYGSLGQLSIYPYMQLVSPTGPTNCSWIIWIHFENVELIGPATPQAGNSSFKNSKKSRTASEGEQASAGVGPISSMLVKVSKAAGFLSPVPFLGDYAKTVSWFADIGASAASVFGWSKPINLSPSGGMLRVVNHYFSNVDTIDQSLPLSLSCKNSIGQLPGFSGTDVDEMDFGFFKTIPCWDTTFPWAEAVAAGTQLFSYKVTPTTNIHSRVINTLTVYDLKPVEFVANYFSYWRGSMVFTIKIVKTEFHSGRLAFVYFPTESNDALQPTSYALSSYCHREIVDIRDCNEVTFSIPFLSSQSWKPTTGSNTHTGTFVCYIVDELVAPANVANNVTLLVEYAGGPDMEFSVPKSSPLTPFIGAVPQSGSGGFNNPKPMTNVCEITEGTLGASNPKFDSNINALYTIGEHISSFRTLLKMTNVMPFITAAGTLKYYQMLPFSFPVVHNSGAVVTNPSNVGDLYGALSSIYLFSRGGLRLKFLQTVPPSTTQPNVTTMQVFDTGVFYPGTNFSSASTLDSTGTDSYQLRYCGIQTYHHVQQNLTSEVQVPQYHKWHSRVNSEHMVCGPPVVYGDNGFAGSLATPLILNHKMSGNGDLVPCRAGSDDCTFGTFISIPPMIVRKIFYDVANLIF